MAVKQYWTVRYIDHNVGETLWVEEVHGDMGMVSGSPIKAYAYKFDIAEGARFWARALRTWGFKAIVTRVKVTIKPRRGAKELKALAEAAKEYTAELGWASPKIVIKAAVAYAEAVR